jgi:hypothetical protein
MNGDGFVGLAIGSVLDTLPCQYELPIPSPIAVGPGASDPRRTAIGKKLSAGGLLPATEPGSAGHHARETPMSHHFDIGQAKAGV